VVELIVGIVVPVVMVALRIPLQGFAGDRAPFAFLFVGAALATLLAGWRSGVIAVVAGQILTWYLVILPQWSFALPSSEVRGGLILATVSELLTVLVIALYQREVTKGVRERERRMELLDQARREIDHRAKNNNQTVLSLIQLQAAREKDPRVKAALHQVEDRIAAISIATDHLAIRSEDLSAVGLRDHLCQLCAQLERGLARGEVRVECDIADVTASADTATHLAIIVNELVTNALKHAFVDGGHGLVRVQSRVIGVGLELEVSDDGCGMNGRSRSAGTGLGRKLVDNFAKHLHAKHDISTSASGTTHRLVVPRLE